MIKLVYGTPGTGKTRYVYDRLAEDAAHGVRAFLIVPEQMTVAAERDALLYLPASAQLQIEVLNFSRLANRICREYGGLIYNYAAPGLRRLMMWRSLGEIGGQLSAYGSRAGDDLSLADSMLRTVKELKANGITPADVDEVLKKLNEGSNLARKMKDVSLVWSVYEANLGKKYADSNDDLPRLCRLLTEKDYFSGMNVYVDGFTSFTGQEHDLLRVLMRQAENVTVTVGLAGKHVGDIDTLTISECEKTLLTDISSFAGEYRAVSLTENHRSKNPELALVSSSFWSAAAPKRGNVPKTRGPIRLLSASDVYEESEDAAAKIRALLEENDGWRCRDILIVTRNADRYRGIIDPALEKMGIPYFFSEKSTLFSSPLSRMFLSALNVFQYGWKAEDVLNHLKSGLCGIPTEDADLFECYVTKWKITGRKFTSGDEWKMNPRRNDFRTAEKDLWMLATVNRVKTTLAERLKSFQSALESAPDIQGMCAASVRYLESLGVSEALRELARRELSGGHLREAQETVRLYDAFLTALESVCDAYEGAPKPDLRTFASAVRLILESTELGSIPTSFDAVTIGSADLLRADAPRAVFILGACDGQFPAAVTDDGLLSDEERSVLYAADLRLSGGKDERSSDELYYFRRAAAAASERLFVYTSADGSPSIGFNRMKTLFPSIEVESVRASLPDRLRTAEAAAEYVNLLKGTSLEPTVRSAIDRYRRENGGTDSGQVPIPLKADKDSISTETALRIHSGLTVLSHSALEKYVNCHFAFFCRYALRLEPWEKIELSGGDIGSFLHKSLEDYLKTVYTERNEQFMNDEELREFVRAEVERFLSESAAANDSEKKMMENTCRRIRAITPALLKNVSDDIRKPFVPFSYEQRIGGGAIPSEIFAIREGDAMGKKFSLTGSIDRVDVWRDGENAYIRAVDYKSGSALPDLRQYRKGKNLQLYLYMFTILANVNSAARTLFGGTPRFGSIAYKQVKPALDSTYNYVEEDQMSAYVQKRQSASELFDPQVYSILYGDTKPKFAREKPVIPAPEAAREEVRRTILKIASDIFTGKAAACPDDPMACSFCEYAHICRAKAAGAAHNK